MNTMESHLATDAMAFLDHRQNVRCVLAERPCYEVDVASKLVMANECRSKRATESETFVEDDGYESLVCVGPLITTCRKLRTVSFGGERDKTL